MGGDFYLDSGIAGYNESSKKEKSKQHKLRCVVLSMICACAPGLPRGQQRCIACCFFVPAAVSPASGSRAVRHHAEVECSLNSWSGRTKWSKAA